MSDMVKRLKRNPERWAAMNMTAVMEGSPAQALFALEDAKADIATLAAELSRLSALVAWQDIETAPKDGRYVWLWNKHADHPADAPQRFFWSTHYSVFGLGGCWTNGLATMGDKIDFDFWCEFLPAGFLDPYAPSPPVSQLKDTTNADK